MRTLRLSLIALAVVSSLANAGEPQTMDSAYLAGAKARLATGDASLQPALQKLLQDADALLLLPSETVTNKKVVPPSGDKHDYLSLAPYWWPDPARPDGLPYKQRDGEFNPAAKNGDTDAQRMQYMCHGVHKLSLAYYFTGEAKYARKAAEAIRTWFLEPATRMRPHLQYGQAVMGKVEGRGIGLIDTRNLWMVADGANLVEAGGALSAADMKALRQWFSEFQKWMLSSRNGLEEAAAANNHGTYFDMQIAAYGLFTGDTASAQRAVKNALTERIHGQVAADGSQPRELARTTPFHYSAFNLDAMTNLARYGEQVGVDLWQAGAPTGGLQKALNYMLPFTLKPASWPHKELRGVETELMLPVLLRAERAYGDGTYAAAVTQLAPASLATSDIVAANGPLGTAAPSTTNTVDRLIWSARAAGK